MFQNKAVTKIGVLAFLVTAGGLGFWVTPTRGQAPPSCTHEPKDCVSRGCFAIQTQYWAQSDTIGDECETNPTVLPQTQFKCAHVYEWRTLDWDCTKFLGQVGGQRATNNCS